MLIAQDVPPGTRVLDTYQPMDLASCLQASALGYGAMVRYIDNLTLREVEWITIDGKMGLMLIRTCRKAGWMPTQLIGTADGQSIAAAAARLGLPKGVSGFLDDEEPGGTAEDEIAYLNAGTDAINTYCLAGGYIGSDTRMSSDQLYHRLRMTRYWKAGSNEPPVAIRGYAMYQEPPLNRILAGMPERLFDVSVANGDALGGRCVMAVAA